MRELESEGRGCGECGARVRGVYACESWNVAARAVSFVDAFECERVGRAPRERSVLAHAAGFAGVLYLFHNSFTPLALSPWRLVSASGSFFAAGLILFAPLALVLAFAAGVSLDRSRGKSGALPALFGLVVGLWGTFDLLLVFEPWLRYLNAF
jgi:hypothetical protein